ncbi:hypothetical protein ACVXHA_17920 [Escherichia coli]
MGFETVAAGKNGLWELRMSLSTFFPLAVRPFGRPQAGRVCQIPRRCRARYPSGQSLADPELLKADWHWRLADEKFDIDGYIRQARVEASWSGGR